jgi:peptidoglycan/LPS O-acetylase OafA/YrhL
MEARMPLNTQQRRAIMWSVIIISTFVVAFWRYTGIAFPDLQLRILIVAFGTVSGAMNLYRGILLGFSKHGGWTAAAVPLLWAGVALFISFSALASPNERELALYPTVAAAVLALAASVLSQRNKERSDAG